MTKIAHNSQPALHVIGLGTEAPAILGPAAQQALAQAEVVIGAERHFAMLSDYRIEALRLHYPRPFAELKTILARHADKRLALLASGDPLFFGVGNWLMEEMAKKPLRFHPNVSSVQTAFSRIGLAWHDSETISLHGRPLSHLRARLHTNRRYALLTDEQSSPQNIAQVLQELGLTETRFWVCEALGLPEENIRSFSLTDLLYNEHFFYPLQVVLLETAGTGSGFLEFPGLPDEAFATDGQPGHGLLTKREVRLAALSLLQPAAQETGWDIGAGCGGISVEWARWNRQGKVYAIEQHRERLQHLATNRDRFGVVLNLDIVPGRAPAAFAALPDPDAVFVGGSDGELSAILTAVWQRLKANGRMVACAVTETAKAELIAFTNDNRLAAQWLQIAVSRGEQLAGRLLMRPMLPVTLVLWRRS